MICEMKNERPINHNHSKHKIYNKQIIHLRVDNRFSSSYLFLSPEQFLTKRYKLLLYKSLQLMNCTRVFVLSHGSMVGSEFKVDFRQTSESNTPSQKGLIKN